MWASLVLLVKLVRPISSYPKYSAILMNITWLVGSADLVLQAIMEAIQPWSGIA